MKNKNVLKAEIESSLALLNYGNRPTIRPVSGVRCAECKKEVPVDYSYEYSQTGKYVCANCLIPALTNVALKYFGYKFTQENK
jgi:hypothetical protein